MTSDNGYYIVSFMSKFNVNLSAEAFLDADNLASDLDSWSKPSVGEEKYADGLKTGKNAETVYVAINNVWSARMKDGSSLQSYEKLGYHGRTSDFWRGILESGCSIVVYRSGSKNGIKIK